MLNSSPFNLPSSTPARVAPAVSSTFKPFEASLGPSSPAPNSFVLSTAEQPQKPQLGTSPQQPSFAPIILDTPVGGSFLDSPVGGGSPLPTVPPEVDLSTSQQPAVVKAGEDYYYYYYYYDDDEESSENSPTEA